MTIRTFSVEIDDTAYVKVGSSVILFEVVERMVGYVRIVVRDVGDPGPNINTDQFRPLDGTYTREADAVDIWMASPNGPTTVYGERL